MGAQSFHWYYEPKQNRQNLIIGAAYLLFFAFIVVQGATLHQYICEATILLIAVVPRSFRSFRLSNHSSVSFRLSQSGQLFGRSVVECPKETEILLVLRIVCSA
jgi:hypothetical protein